MATSTGKPIEKVIPPTRGDDEVALERALAFCPHPAARSLLRDLLTEKVQKRNALKR